MKQVFAKPEQLSTSLCEEDSVWSDKLLDFHCPLFARKFPSVTAVKVRDTLADCQNKLDIIQCGGSQSKGRRVLSLQHEE